VAITTSKQHVEYLIASRDSDVMPVTDEQETYTRHLQNTKLTVSCAK